MGMAAALGLAAACGGGGDETRLDVRFSEWEIGVSEAIVGAGEVRLELRNEGTVSHNLVIVKSDLPPGELPVSDGSVDVSRLNVEGGAGPVAPGTSMEGEAAFGTSLTAGKYVLFCDVVSGGESHYENGMYAPLLVEL